MTDTRPALNGAKLLAAAQHPRHGGWVVLVDWGRNPQPFVTAYADSLDSPSWVLGHYFSAAPEARVDFVNRAGLNSTV